MMTKEYRTWRIIILIFNILLHVAIFLSLTNFDLSDFLKREPSYFEFSSFSEGKGSNPNVSGVIMQNTQLTDPDEIKKLEIQADLRKIIRVDFGGIKIFKDSIKNLTKVDTLLTKESLKTDGIAGDTIKNIPNAETLSVNGNGIGNGSTGGGGKRPAVAMPMFLGGEYHTFADWVFNQLYSQPDFLNENFAGKVIVDLRISKIGDLQIISISNCDNKKIKDKLTKIIQSSPRWVPGNNGGRPKEIEFELPINFKVF